MDGDILEGLDFSGELWKRVLGGGTKWRTAEWAGQGWQLCSHASAIEERKQCVALQVEVPSPSRPVGVDSCQAVVAQR
jgi:hypothetical protein